jgi:hypothetical protein
VWNAGAITKLTNHGQIDGGTGAIFGTGGAGVINHQGADLGPGAQSPLATAT